MVLAQAAADDHHWVRRLRTLTIGFFTPFYFIRAGSLVSVPAVATGLGVFLALLAGRVLSKIFGTISALYGFTHGIVTQAQYSLLVAVVIASAVVATMIANWAFMPHHLVAEMPMADEEMTDLDREAETSA